MTSTRGVAIAVALAACVPSLKSTFKDLNYPQQPGPPGPDAEDITLYATLEPVIDVGFDDPSHAADCFDAVLGDRAQVDGLRGVGECLAKTSTAPATCGATPSAWRDCNAAKHPSMTCTCKDGATDGTCVIGAACTPIKGWSCTVSLPAACSALNPRDRGIVLSTLAATGEALIEYEFTHYGPHFETAKTTRLGVPVDDATWARFSRVAHAATANLRCDGSNANPACATASGGAPQTDLRPAWALSGGSANGAFTAGYLYELMLAREQAIMRFPADKAKLDAERISAVTGTSVGALIAPVVDLYFVEAPVDAATLDWCDATTRVTHSTPPPDCTGNPLADCDAIPSRGSRPAQHCAMQILRKYLTDVTEQDLLCIYDAKMTGFISGPNTSLGAFEPIATSLIYPFSQKLLNLLTSNDVVRVTMSADVTTNVLMGLDERACRHVADPASCLAKGVLASIPNPLFAHAETLVYTGLTPNGEAGHWLDGGLRSGAPAMRAMMLTKATANPRAGGKILMISTERSEGIPAPAPTSGMADAVYSMNALVGQMHHWEIANATLYQRARADRLRFFDDALAGLVSTATGAAAPTAGFGPVYTTFVPAKLDPVRLGAAGYQFDPLIMRGLFLWGQRLALDAMRDTERGLLDFMGWQYVKGHSADYLGARRATWDLRFARYMAEFGPIDAAWDKHVAQRRDEIDGMVKCKGPP